MCAASLRTLMLEISLLAVIYSVKQVHIFNCGCSYGENFVLLLIGGHFYRIFLLAGGRVMGAITTKNIWTLEWFSTILLVKAMPWTWHLTLKQLFSVYGQNGQGIVKQFQFKLNQFKRLQHSRLWCIRYISARFCLEFVPIQHGRSCCKLSVWIDQALTEIFWWLMWNINGSAKTEMG